MDNQLNPLIKIDDAAGTARIDIRGSLTQASRPELMHQIQRVRRMGISSPITVDLSHAAFVESVALAGLRFDLNALDAGARQVPVAGAPGVFLEVMSTRDHAVAESRPDFTALTNPSELSEALEDAGLRPLSDYSRDELLAASDSVFGLLDDPAGHSGQELLARYDAIVEEIARRELAEPAEPAEKHAPSN
ncbi:hypothetical protein B1A87_015750 [Arthrobacter sp. KBS0703]|uniref:hypothetical protein n=1 Tax=Bacteria TaxID=2 RepID=UPI00098F8F5A|nr:hypothetical protein [Arthrobacter sp. KBS0703]TSE17044.1 hypothetical protein B1A87_015750 [Arthrobacter sp. KBS0703]